WLREMIKLKSREWLTRALSRRPRIADSGGVQRHSRTLKAIDLAPHEAVIGAHIGEALPFVARHFADQRSFTVNDLVMRNRQDEIFGEGVEEPEGHLVVAPTPIDRVARHVFQRVVHPTHVPLEAETQTAEVGRRRDA